MLWWLVACQVGEPAPRAVSVPVVLEAERGAPSGWRVDRLVLRGADLRAEAPTEGLARGRWPLLIASAHAHPGHDASGGVALELLGDWQAEPLLGEVALGEAVGVEGPLATASFRLTGLTLEAVREGSSPLPLTVDLDVERTVPGLVARGALRAGEAQGGRLVLSLEAMVEALSVPLDDTNADGRLDADDEGVANAVIFAATTSAAWSFNLETL
jgi:hypothetical protein